MTDPIAIIQTAHVSAAQARAIVKALNDAGFGISPKLPAGEIAVSITVEEPYLGQKDYTATVSFDGGLHSIWAKQGVRAAFMPTLDPSRYKHELSNWLVEQLGKSLIESLTWALYKPVAAAVGETEAEPISSGDPK